MAYYIFVLTRMQPPKILLQEILRPLLNIRLFSLIDKQLKHW